VSGRVAVADMPSPPRSCLFGPQIRGKFSIGELRSVMQVDDIYERNAHFEAIRGGCCLLSLLSGNVLSGSMQLRRFYKFIPSELAIL
jgi:hypothetical protein